MKAVLIRRAELQKIVVFSFVLVSVSNASISHDGKADLGIQNKCPVVPVITVIPVNCANWLGNSNSSLTHTLPRYVIYNGGVESESEVLLPSKCREVEVSCRASQPIIWTYDGPKNQDLPYIIKSVKSMRNATSPWKEETSMSCSEMKFTVTITPYSEGRYICTLSTNSNVSISRASNLNAEIEGNVSGNSSSSLYLLFNENQASKLLERPRSDLSEPITLPIPCKSKQPNMTIELVKWDLDSQTFKNITDDFTVTYDEPTGFHIKANVQSIKDIPGTYKCVFGQHPGTEFVVTSGLDVHEKSERNDDLEIRSHILSPHCVRTNDHNYGHVVGCFSKSGKTYPEGLKILQLECNNPTHCGLLWETSREYLRLLPNYNPAFDDCGSRNTVVQKQSGVIICSAEDGRQYQYSEYFVTQDNLMVLNPSAEQLPAGALITEVDDMSEHQIYLTSSLNITCTATQYLFSDGLQLAVSFNNGSIGSTEDMVEAAQSMPSTKGYYHYEWMVNVTSTDIRKYICVAPLLKSNQWKVKPSVEFNVTVGSRPIFLKNDSRSSPPVLKFRMSDTNVRISCVAEGDPQPEINWYRSGHELFSLGYNSIEKLNIKHYNTVVSSLEIPSMKNMGADVWGIWVCNASNVLKPDAFYEINVEIDEEDSSPVTNILFVALAVVSLIIGAGCFVWHKISTNQRIEKVRNQYCRKFLDGDFSLLELIKNSANINGRKIARAMRYLKEIYEIDPKDINKGDVLEVLGQGNFGIVIKATYSPPNEQPYPVAIKMPKKADYFQAALLQEELKVLSYVGNHEHVIRLVGAVTKDIFYGQIEVILEYCETSLDKFLKKHWAYYCNEVDDDKIRFSLNSERQGGSNEARNATQSSAGYVTISFAALDFRTFDLIRWSYQIACAMQYLASRKIIHRDLAPRNILINDTSGDHRGDIKIADFGLSKKLDKKQYYYTKLIQGSDSEAELPWRHLAPELLQEDKMVFSESTDVWSYGITLWEMFSLAKLHPYSEFSTFTGNFINAVKYGNYRNPMPEYANSEIYEIMCKCWKAGPSERPKFTDLTKEFLRLLPKEYVKTIPESVYEPPTLNMAELGTLFPKPENTAVIFKDKDIIAENNNSCFKYLTIFLNRHGDT